MKCANRGIILIVAGLPRLLPAGPAGLMDLLLPDYYCAHDCINTQITFLSLASHVRYIKLLTK